MAGCVCVVGQQGEVVRRRLSSEPGEMEKD